MTEEMKGFAQITLPPQISRSKITITIHGKSVEIPYARSGMENPATVIVPGASGLGRIPFRENIEPIAQQLGARVMVLDTPPMVGIKPSLELDVEIIGECLDKISPRHPVDLVGYSARGIGAMIYALEHQERVRKLVLVASAGLRREIYSGFRHMTLPIIGDILARISIQPTKESVEKSLKVLFYDPEKIPDGLAEEILQQYLNWGFKKWCEWYLATLRQGVNFWGQKIIVLDELRALSEKIPILVVWGEHDRMLSYRQMVLAKVACPKIQIHLMEGCGHWPQMEKPEEFSRIVADFLRD